MPQSKKRVINVDESIVYIDDKNDFDCGTNTLPYVSFTIQTNIQTVFHSILLCDFRRLYFQLNYFMQ